MMHFGNGDKPNWHRQCADELGARICWTDIYTVKHKNTPTFFLSQLLQHVPSSLAAATDQWPCPWRSAWTQLSL